MEKKFLLPGYLFISSNDVQVTTVLGSCVSVCIYDTILQIGGMNHFIYPDVGKDTATCVYGSIANYELLKRMKKNYGTNYKNCIVHVVGGTGTLAGSKVIADRNVESTRNFLKAFQFKKILYDVGGKKSRKVIFNTYTGEIIISTLS